MESELIFPAAGSRRGTAFLIHGLTATTAEVSPLAKFLAARGYQAVAPLLPGHGTSLKELSKVPLRKFLETVEQSFNACVTESRLPVVVIGESFGALLGLHLAKTRPEFVRALGLLSIPLKFRSNLREKALRQMSQLPDAALNRLGVSKKRARDLGKFQYQFIAYDAHSIGAAARLVALRQQVISNVRAINCPVCVLADPNDHHCLPEAVSEFVSNLPAERKELHHIPGGEHELLVGPKSREVFGMLYSFIVNVHEKN